MHLHGGQQVAQGRLVNGLSLQLGHCRVAQDGKLAQQMFIAVACVNLDNEVTALGMHIGGIGCRPQQHLYSCRAIDVVGIADGQVIDEACHIMGLIEVGFNIKMSAHSDGERLFHKAELIEVELLEVGRQRAVETLC